MEPPPPISPSDKPMIRAAIYPKISGMKTHYFGCKDEIPFENTT
jgi:hypothetical protein